LGKLTPVVRVDGPQRVRKENEVEKNLEGEKKGKRNIIEAQEIATNVVLKLQKLSMVPPFAWTGMDPGKETVQSFPEASYSQSYNVKSRLFEFWWDEWVHVLIELRKPFSVEGPWNPAQLVLKGFLSELPIPENKESKVFRYEYRELRALLGLTSGEVVFYHPNNGKAPNSLLWRGRYESKL
jgi:hypothetical protein